MWKKLSDPMNSSVVKRISDYLAKLDGVVTTMDTEGYDAEVR